MKIIAVVSIFDWVPLIFGIIIAFCFFVLISFFLLEHFRLVWRLRRRERQREIIRRYKRRKKNAKLLRQGIIKQAKLEHLEKLKQQNKGPGST